MTTDAPNPTPVFRARALELATLISLALAYVLLLISPDILAAAGGMVEIYLAAIVFAVLPLGWGNRQLVKAAAALALLTSVWLAGQDHERGIVRQRRVFETQLKAATQPTTAPSTSDWFPSPQAIK